MWRMRGVEGRTAISVQGGQGEGWLGRNGIVCAEEERTGRVGPT